jgi:hypothetical protein
MIRFASHAIDQPKLKASAGFAGIWATFGSSGPAMVRSLLWY